jgi:hypothetical protein
VVARHTPSALLAANAPPSLRFVALDRQPWWAYGGTEAAVAGGGGAIEPALGQRMPPAVLDWVHCGIAAVVPCHRRPFHGCYYVAGKIEGRLYGHLPHGQLSLASLLTTRHNVRCDLSSSSAPEALDFFSLFILRARNLSPRTSQ